MNGKNNSIETMKLYYYIEKKNCILFDLLKKFPNLSDITLYSINGSKTTTIEIKENEQCKVDKISLTVNGNNNIKFYTKPFHYFIKFELNINNKITNLKEFFPIFGNNCQIIFDCLVEFKLTNTAQYEIDISILNNIYNNIDFMPKLEIFYLKCIINNIEEDFYQKFIKKLLLLKLKSINFEIKNNGNDTKELYSLRELKKIVSGINTINLDKIYISKL